MSFALIFKFNSMYIVNDYVTINCIRKHSTVQHFAAKYRHPNSAVDIARRSPVTDTIVRYSQICLHNNCHFMN